MVSQVYNIGGISVSLKQIIIVVVTAVLLAVFCISVKTSLGRAQRAQTASGLLCIDVDCTPSINFIMAVLAVSRRHPFLDVSRRGLVLRRLRAGCEGLHQLGPGGIGSVAGRRARRALIGFIESMWSAYFDRPAIAAAFHPAIVLIFLPSASSAGYEVEKV